MIRSLLSYPCKMSCKAIIATLPYKIKEQAEKKACVKYIATALQLSNENLAIISNAATHGEANGKYISIGFDEFLNPEKRKVTKTGDEIVKDVLIQLGLEV